MSAPRIVVTSPWKLGLFVFLLVTACGFGLIYAYYGYFGGRLDFHDTLAVRNFYMVCGAVAFLGLLGYLAIVSAAQPADSVAHFGQRRRKLLKKAAGIEDPTEVDLENFQHEPALAAVLERWREDRQRLEEAESAGLKPEQSQRLEALSRQLEALRDETNGLVINAALQLSRLGEEAAPLLQTMEQLQEISSRHGQVAVELKEMVGKGPVDGQFENDSELESGQQFMLETQSAATDTDQVSGTETTGAPRPQSPADLGLETPMAPVPQRTPLQETGAAPIAPQPVAMDVSSEDQLAAIHDELFHRTPPTPVPSPVETHQEEEVYDLSAFGAVELPPADPTGESGERIYDLREFGAVEL